MNEGKDVESTQCGLPAAREFDIAICAAAAETSLLGPEMFPSARDIVEIICRKSIG